MVRAGSPDLPHLADEASTCNWTGEKAYSVFSVPDACLGLCSHTGVSGNMLPWCHFQVSLLGAGRSLLEN